MKPTKTAIIGAGMAGITCARTLAQAGHAVEVFEKSRSTSGRMSTRRTEFGGFDHGAQYFTARDPRFLKALATNPSKFAPWVAVDGKANTYVAVPGMSALVAAWALPLQQNLNNQNTIHLETLVKAIEPDPINKNQWQLRTTGADGDNHIFAGFDQVILAIPSTQASALLIASDMSALAKPLANVQVQPCWTLMLAFPEAADQATQAFGPTWNAKLFDNKSVDHPRIAWLARESSKPGREPIERWTVQARADWSQEHLEDDAQTVRDKLQRAFSEVTGIRAEPHLAQVHRWRYAQTSKPMGKPFLWNKTQGIGVCGDWCIGHRVEDAFVSGLELALAAI